MTDSTLTPKQSYFLKCLQEADVAGQPIVQLAEQENVSAASLYNYRHVLRQKCHLARATSVSSRSSNAGSGQSAFAAVPMTDPASSSSNQLIELKTQLANGQPIWMSLPADQLPVALAALSSLGCGNGPCHRCMCTVNPVTCARALMASLSHRETGDGAVTVPTGAVRVLRKRQRISIC